LKLTQLEILIDVRCIRHPPNVLRGGLANPQAVYQGNATSTYFNKIQSGGVIQPPAKLAIWECHLGEHWSGIKCVFMSRVEGSD